MKLDRGQAMEGPSDIREVTTRTTHGSGCSTCEEAATMLASFLAAGVRGKVTTYDDTRRPHAAWLEVTEL